MSDPPEPKRRRVEVQEQHPLSIGNANVLDSLEEDELADVEIPSDTVAAFRLLRQEFPTSAKVTPIILRSQIYAIVKDRTVVDRCLEEQRQAGSLRMIKLPGSVDDYAFMLSEDYEACIRLSEEELLEKGKSSQELEIFELFALVARKFQDTNIPHKKLVSLLTKARREKHGKAAVVSDAEMAPLFTTSLLTRQVGDQSQYLFAVANAGKFISSISKGRKEILSLLARKRYKEAFAKDMHRWKLKGSCLDMQWHLRDLEGRGNIQIASTPSGQLVRLLKKL